MWKIINKIIEKKHIKGFDKNKINHLSSLTFFDSLYLLYSFIISGIKNNPAIMALIPQYKNRIDSTYGTIN